MEVLKNMGKLFIAMAVAALAFCLVGCSGGQQSTPAKSEPAPLEIINSGYTLVDDDGLQTGTYGVVIKNNNSDWVAKDIEVLITGRDADGNVVGTQTDYADIICNGGEFNLGGSCFFNNAETLEFEIKDADNMWSEDNMDEAAFNEQWPVNGVTQTVDEFGYTTVGGEITNNTDKDAINCTVSIVFFDANGAIVGGTMTSLNEIKAKTTLPFSAESLIPETFDSVKVSANPKVL